jgi:hypothetical protein
MGMTETAASPITSTTTSAFSDTRDRQTSVYARVTIPIGKRPQRIDCTRVYELEIQKVQREVELLKLNAR